MNFYLNIFHSKPCSYSFGACFWTSCRIWCSSTCFSFAFLITCLLYTTLFYLMIKFFPFFSQVLLCLFLIIFSIFSILIFSMGSLLRFCSKVLINYVLVPLHITIFNLHKGLNNNILCIITIYYKIYKPNT